MKKSVGFTVIEVITAIAVIAVIGWIIWYKMRASADIVRIVPYNRISDLSITDFSSQNPVSRGDNVSYTISIKNNGSESERYIKIEIKDSAGNIIQTIRPETLQPTYAKQYYFKRQIPPKTAAGDYIFTAIISGDYSPDATPLDNTKSLTLTVKK